MAEERNKKQAEIQNKEKEKVQNPADNEANKVPKTADPTKQPITGTNATHQGDGDDVDTDTAAAGTTDGTATGGGGAGTRADNGGNSRPRGGRKKDGRDVDTAFDSDNKNENEDAAEAVKDARDGDDD